MNARKDARKRACSTGEETLAIELDRRLVPTHTTAFSTGEDGRIKDPTHRAASLGRIAHRSAPHDLYTRAELSHQAERTSSAWTRSRSPERKTSTLFAAIERRKLES